MSFSAWFSALGRPFFLPSVLSLVAFPANRRSARHRPASPAGGAAVPAILLPGPSLPPPGRLPRSARGSASALGCRVPALARKEIPLWQAMPAPLQFSAQPLHRSWLLLLVFANPLSFHLHRAVSAQLGLALENRPSTWVGRNPSTTTLLSRRNLRPGQHAGQAVERRNPPSPLQGQWGWAAPGLQDIGPGDVTSTRGAAGMGMSGGMRTGQGSAWGIRVGRRSHGDAFTRGHGSGCAQSRLLWHPEHELNASGAEMCPIQPDSATREDYEVSDVA